MTIYELSVISTTGFPYYNLKVNNIPKGVRLYLRFFDFSEEKENNISTEKFDHSLEFDLKAGLISALYEFAKSIDKNIKLLEFKTKTENIEKENLGSKDHKGDVLLTLTTEPFLLHKSVQKKIELIYDIIISSKVPLDSAYEILANEEDLITNILTDKSALDNIQKNLKRINSISEQFLNEMGMYGLKGICITSFDLSPLKVFSNEYQFEDINQILRNIGFIPDIEPYEWIYRISFINNQPVWVYIEDKSNIS
jgi:hypothetical protein